MGLFGRSKRKKRKAAAAKERKQIAENNEYNRKAQLVATKLNASFANPRVDPNQYADVSGGAFDGQGGTGGKAAPVNQEPTTAEAALGRQGDALNLAQQRLNTQQAREEARNINNRADDLNRSNNQESLRGIDPLGQSLLQGFYIPSGSFFNDGTKGVKKKKKVYGMYNVPGYKAGTMKAGGK